MVQEITGKISYLVGIARREEALKGKIMKKLIAIMLFVLGLTFGVQANAQTSIPITIGQSNGPGNCQQSNTTLNCYSVFMTIGGNSGTAWVYSQGQAGFILFRPNLQGAGYVEAFVTSSTVNSRNAIGQVTQLTITYTLSTDPNSDGDTDTVMGSITFNLAQTTGRYAHASVIGGFGQQTVTQD